MKIIIDNEIVNGSVETVHEFIRKALHDGRYLKSVQVDGEEYPIQHLSADSVHADSCVVVSSCTFDEIIIDYMGACHQFLPVIRGTLVDASEKMTVGNTEEGIPVLSNAIDAIGTVLQLLEQLVQRAPEPETLVERVYVDGLHEIAQIVRWVEIKDTVAAVDEVNYRLLPWVDSFYTLCETFLQQMRLETMKTQFY